MKICFMIGVLLGLTMPAAWVIADQPPTIPRIGLLKSVYGPSSSEEGLHEGLRELGYIEGKNIVIEWRRTLGHEDALRPLAAELVQMKPDVIAAFGTPAARAALAATTTVPVVFSSGDPVTTGLAASLAKPGGNGTGVSLLSVELIAKRLELLHQLAPRARRIVCLMNSSNPIGPLQLEEAQKAARIFGLQLITLDARNEAELDTALRAFPRSAADGVLVTSDNLFIVNKAKVARAVRTARLPAIFSSTEYHEAGVLMSYGPDLRESGRKMAVYVDKILKGAKPGDLPIEQISKYELVIDVRVAGALGIKVPQELLLRADEVLR